VFLGGLIPNETNTARQRNMAQWQSKNKCRIVSGVLQKQQALLPFQILLAKLSFVTITPFFKNQRKILIFNGTFVQGKVLLLSSKEHAWGSHAGETRWHSSQQLIELATSLYTSILLISCYISQFETASIKNRSF
jgi:hypothetical protein